jgi:hypothetical protein
MLGEYVFAAQNQPLDKMLEVRPSTVVFMRALDLDKVEHSQITMTFFVKNISKDAICEFSGKGILVAAGQTRTEYVQSYKRLEPGRIELLDVAVLLSNTDAALKEVPLLEIATRWQTSAVKNCGAAAAQRV